MLVNGSPQGFFELRKGIRQGDQLTPFIFIILVEVLGRLITERRVKGQWKGVKVARGVDPISHLQFVDDTFLTGEASEREARVMKKL